MVKVAEKKDYGCDDCIYLGHRKKTGWCKLWQVVVDNAHNSHCEVVLSKYGRK